MLLVYGRGKQLEATDPEIEAEVPPRAVIELHVEKGGEFLLCRFHRIPVRAVYVCVIVRAEGP